MLSFGRCKWCDVCQRVFRSCSMLIAMISTHRSDPITNESDEWWIEFTNEICLDLIWTRSNQRNATVEMAPENPKNLSTISFPINLKSHINKATTTKKRKNRLLMTILGELVFLQTSCGFHVNLYKVNKISLLFLIGLWAATT